MQYEYKYLSNAFSSRMILRQVEKYESDGWQLHLLQPSFFFILGFGGSSGMMAVMRQSRHENKDVTNTTADDSESPTERGSS